MISVTGGYELKRTWFPYSKLYLSPGPSTSPQDAAYNTLIAYLQDNDYIGTSIDVTAQNNVLTLIHNLIQRYGHSTLGFGPSLPKTLGPALKRFDLTLEEDPNHDSRNKIIRYKAPVDEGSEEA